MKTKILITRKQHRCFKCDRRILKGSKVKMVRYYPAEAEAAGAIDVNFPLTIYYCNKCNEVKND